MNLGHISSTSAPIVKIDSSICFFLFVCFDMNAMYCILKGFSLYNFGNKFVFIVIVIVNSEGDPPVNPGFPSQWASMWSFDVSFWHIEQAIEQTGKLKRHEAHATCTLKGV